MSLKITRRLTTSHSNSLFFPPQYQTAIINLNTIATLYNTLCRNIRTLYILDHSITYWTITLDYLKFIIIHISARRQLHCKMCTFPEILFLKQNISTVLLDNHDGNFIEILISSHLSNNILPLQSLLYPWNIDYITLVNLGLFTAYSIY